MIHEGLTDAFHDIHMGITAENVAERYPISREEQDAFAAESQARAEAAIHDGRFKAEIVAVPSQKKGEAKLVDTDEIPRPGPPRSPRPAEARLQEGRDGDRGQRQRHQRRRGGGGGGLGGARAAGGVSPLARIVSYASAAVDPKVMGIGPVPAVRKALEKAGLSLDRIDLFELNEAFAAQSLAVLRELKLEPGEGQRERRRHRPRAIPSAPRARGSWSPCSTRSRRAT